MSPLPISMIALQPNATAAQTIALIAQMEAAGVPGAWMPTFPVGLDPVTTLAAAAVQCPRITLGTSIVTTYPRHPITLASQALVMAELAPGRFRLGIGSSHPYIIEDMYGLSFARPLAHLREYVAVLRGLLSEGRVDFAGEYYRVRAELPPGMQPASIPLPISTVRPRMFRLAGEIGDGAITGWCPLSYIQEIALPELRAGAEAAGRPTPPMIMTTGVVWSTDRERVYEVARQTLAFYLRSRAYSEMFALAGYPLDADGVIPAELIDELFIYGDPPTIAARLRALLDAGVDEVAVACQPAVDPATEFPAIVQLVGQLAQEG